MCVQNKKTKQKQYDLTDIGKEISRVMNTSTAEIIRSGAVDLAGLVNPIIGIVAGMGNNILSKYNDFKLGCLLKGIASNLNVEMRLNQLYTFVTSSSEKALTVANLFKQTINAECPKSCIIYGLILASHLESDTNFTQNELIVCKAIENATDFDLDNFKEIMEKYLQKTSSGNKIVFPIDFPEISTFITTCDWCVYNRIFVSRSPQWGEMEEGTLDIGPYYYEAEPARLLLNYINNASRIWNYMF